MPSRHCPRAPANSGSGWEGAPEGAPGLAPSARVGRSGKINWAGVSADRVKLIQAVNTGGAGESVPLVATTFAPAIDPGLTCGGKGKRTQVAGFAMYAMLITAQKGSFHRITFKSSHRVLPSLVDCDVHTPHGEAVQLFSCVEVRCRRNRPQGKRHCIVALVDVLTKALRPVNDRLGITPH